MKCFIYLYFVMIVVWEFMVYLTILSKLDRGLWRFNRKGKFVFPIKTTSYSQDEFSISSLHNLYTNMHVHKYAQICTCGGWNFKETIPLSIITGSCDTIRVISLSCDTIKAIFLIMWYYQSYFWFAFFHNSRVHLHVQKMKCQKKLFPWVRSRDLHWGKKTYQYPPIKNSDVISKDRYTPIRGSHDASYGYWSTAIWH